MKKIFTLLLIPLCIGLIHAQGKIALTTQKELHSAYWSFKIKADEAEKSAIWIDWNNNGTKDEGEDEVDYRWGNSGEIVTPTITIHGNLKSLKVEYMDLTSIVIWSAPQLEEIDLRSNKLKTVDLRNAPKLKKITLNKNSELTSVQVAPECIPLIEEFYAIMCDLQSLDLSRATALTLLELTENKHLTTLDLKNCQALESADLSKCTLEDLTMGSHPSLQYLMCHENKLSSLDLSGAPILEELWCFSNALKELRIPSATTLLTIKCYNNRLSGKAMASLIALLPTTSSSEASLFGINIEMGAPEQNVIWKEDVATAKSKGWQVLARKNQYQDVPYEGTDKIIDPRDRYTTDLPKITLKRSNQNVPWNIQITTNEKDALALWADLNGNNQYELGEELSSMSTQQEIVAPCTELAIYGKIELLDCSANQLTDIVIGEKATLKELHVQNNALTSLNLQNALLLRKLQCQNNFIVAPKVAMLISSLPFVADETFHGELLAVDLSNPQEKNVFLLEEVAQAQENGWDTYCIDENGSKARYEGKDPHAGSVSYSTQCASVTLTRKEDSEKNWTLAIVPMETILNGIWLDINGDGICQEEEKITQFEEAFTSTANAKEVVLYGDYIGLKCTDNDLTQINLEKHTTLKELHCDKNKLRSLALDKAHAMEILECSENKLTSIDLTPCESLKMVYLSQNPLNSIKWPSQNHLEVLTMANCTGFLPTTLDLSEFTALKEIKCNGNKLDKLLLPKTDKLNLVACYDNKLTNLDLSQLPRLEIVICDQNRLSALDLSSNSALEYISIYSNKISEEEMAKLFAQLPDRTRADRPSLLFAIDSEDYGEENLCRKALVEKAKALNWVVYDNKGRRNNGMNLYHGYTDMEDSFEGEVWDGTATSWVKGNGTKEEPFLIESPKHLAFLQKEVNSGKTFEGIYFRQTQTLSMGAKELGKEKGNFLPIGIFDGGYVTDPQSEEQTYQDDSKRFQGYYDGRNNAIINLYQYYNNNESKTVGGHGLFGCIGPKGEVTNLYLSRSCTFEGDFEGGSLASYLEGKISHCGSHATVRGTSIIGGLVAVLSGGEIAQSFFSGLAVGTMNVGGLAGYVGTPEDGATKGKQPVIVDAYVNANIQSSSSYIGVAIGLIAEKPSLRNIYATGALTGDALSFMKGAFAGALDGKVADEKDKLEIANCYYDSTRIAVKKASSDGNIKGIEALTEAQMKEEAFLEKLGKSFAMDETHINRGYPILPKSKLTANEEVHRDSFDLLSYSIQGLELFVHKEASEIVEVYTIDGAILLRTNESHITLPASGNYLLKVGKKRAVVTL